MALSDYSSFRLFRELREKNGNLSRSYPLWQAVEQKLHGGEAMQ